MNQKKEEIKRLDFEKRTITIREAYIDENGHERDREKQIEMPIFPYENLSLIAQKIYDEIKKLPVQSEFTIHQFMKDYNILNDDRFELCDLVFELCEKNNLIIKEKQPGAFLGMPWDIPRIKKK